MTYRIRQTETVEQAVRRIAEEQLHKAIDELTDTLADRSEAVHASRKRMKKLRGLVRLVRPELGETYTRENRCFRDAARGLSQVRDATAMIECFDDLIARYDDAIDEDAARATREALVDRRKRITDEPQDLVERIDEFVRTLEQAAERIPEWSIDAEGFDAVEGGVAKVYRRGRKAMHAAMTKPTEGRLHEWRKRVKYQRYHVRLLQDVWSKPMKARRKALKKLSDELGDDHDLALFVKLLREAPQSVGGNREVIDALLALAQRRRAELQSAAFNLGRRVFAESTSAYVDRLEAYWRAWCEQGRTRRMAFEAPTV